MLGSVKLEKVRDVFHFGRMIGDAVDGSRLGEEIVIELGSEIRAFVSRKLSFEVSVRHPWRRTVSSKCPSLELMGSGLGRPWKSGYRQDLDDI